MAGKKFTLLELYLDEIQIGPSALGDDTTAESSPDDEGDADADETGGSGCLGKKIGKFLAVILVLALVALAAKKLLGGGGVEDLDELEDLADIDE